MRLSRAGTSETHTLVRALTSAALALAIASCSYADAVRKFTPADADARARDYLSLFAHRQTDAAWSRLTPRLQTQESRVELAKMSDMLRDRHFDSTKVIGANTSTTGGTRRVNLTYELLAGGRWFEANVATVDSANDWRIEDLHVDSLARPLEAESHFLLPNRTVEEYAWLMATILCPIISIATAIFIFTRRQMPARRRWALMALLGAGTFTMNWSTGAHGSNLFSVQLLSGGWVGSPYSPYMFTFSIPAGAAMAHERYRRWKASSRTVVVDTPSEPSLVRPLP